MVEEREEAGASELHLLLSNHSSDPRIQLLENTAKNTAPRKHCQEYSSTLAIQLVHEYSSTITLPITRIKNTSSRIQLTVVH